VPGVNRRLRDLCRREDCRLWEQPTLELELARSYDDMAVIQQTAADSGLAWLAIQRQQLTAVTVRMQVGHVAMVWSWSAHVLIILALDDSGLLLSDVRCPSKLWHDGAAGRSAPGLGWGGGRLPL